MRKDVNRIRLGLGFHPQKPEDPEARRQTTAVADKNERAFTWVRQKCVVRVALLQRLIN